jgi:hypothetical protein
MLSIKVNRHFIVLLLLLLLCIRPGLASQTHIKTESRVDLKFQTDEPEAVLSIIEKKMKKQPIKDHDWKRLFSTEAYIRLKKREAELDRAFTDQDFKKFVLSDELAECSSSFQNTLNSWKSADLHSVANRILDYLPEQACIRANVFPIIKPKKNSFVYEVTTNPAIFLYLDPSLDKHQFENTVAHELHHIGYANVAGFLEEKIEQLPLNQRTAVEWIGAFGEGFAMLAAAGGPDIHPHKFSKAEDRARWDSDMYRFNSDLKEVEKFLVDILKERLNTGEEIKKRGYSFFGIQGPWYTVGYKMAVMVEKRFGRSKLVECMLDPRLLLSLYNRAATEHNRTSKDKLEVWSTELLKGLGVN